MLHGYWLGPQGTRGSPCPNLSPCARTIGSLSSSLCHSTICCVTGTPDLIGGAAAPLCVLRAGHVRSQLRVLDLICVLIRQGMQAIRCGAVMSSILVVRTPYIRYFILVSCRMWLGVPLPCSVLVCPLHTGLQTGSVTCHLLACISPEGCPQGAMVTLTLTMSNDFVFWCPQTQVGLYGL